MERVMKKLLLALIFGLYTTVSLATTFLCKNDSDCNTGLTGLVCSNGQCSLFGT